MTKNWILIELMLLKGWQDSSDLPKEEEEEGRKKKKKKKKKGEW